MKYFRRNRVSKYILRKNKNEFKNLKIVADAASIINICNTKCKKRFKIHFNFCYEIYTICI